MKVWLDQFAIIERQARPGFDRHLLPVTEQGAQDAGVGDDDGVGRDEAAGEIDGPGLERGNGFAAGRDEMQDVGGPGVECMAVDLIPASPLPVAKI